MRTGDDSIPRVPTRQDKTTADSDPGFSRMKRVESRVASERMINDQEDCYRPRRAQLVHEHRHQYQDGGRRGIRSIYSIPGALANQHKYTGQEHKVGGPKDENRDNLEVAARRGKPKKSKKKNYK